MVFVSRQINILIPERYYFQYTVPKHRLCDQNLATVRWSFHQTGQSFNRKERKNNRKSAQEDQASFLIAQRKN